MSRDVNRVCSGRIVSALCYCFMLQILWDFVCCSDSPNLLLYLASHMPLLADAVPIVSVLQFFTWHHLQTEVLYFRIKPEATFLQKYQCKRICKQCLPKQTRRPCVLGLEVA